MSYFRKSHFEDRDSQAINTVYTLMCAMMVFLMQLGFSLMELGQCRLKNLSTTAIKTMIDTLIGTIMWWVVGYSLAFDESISGLIGQVDFFSENLSSYKEYNNWFFQFAFVSTAATLCGGCLIERIHLIGYLIFSALMSGLVYPVLAHWVWNERGWLKEYGFLDFSGCSVIHMLGGIFGLVGTILIKPRTNRFNPLFENEFKGNNAVYTAIGTFVLWFGWFAFNCGSVFAISEDDSIIVAAKVAINTSISAASSGITIFLLHYSTNKQSREYSLTVLCNGVLAGLIGITAACPYVSTKASFLIGVQSAFLVVCLTKLVEHLQIDDPIDAGAIHFGSGTLGVLSVGIYHSKFGFIYGNSFQQFRIQLVGVVCVIFYAVVMALLVFLFLKLINLLRVSEELEIHGVDFKCCNGLAVNFDEKSAEYLSRIFNIQYSKIQESNNDNACV